MKLSELNLRDKKVIAGTILGFVILALLDTVLAIGVAFIVFLTVIAFLILKKAGFENKTIYTLFLIALLIHLGMVFFIYYANFQPFSGSAGDYSEYDIIAQQVSGRINQGNFSLQGLDVGHFYPVILGYIYTLTIPHALIGQMFNAWLVALLVIFIYLIAKEIGGSEKEAFLAGLIVSIYPSLLFFGSLLLKDALVVLLCSIVMLLILKLLKEFSWLKFLILYIFLGALFHFRIYIACAVLLTFVISWFLFSNLKMKKRLIYGIIIVILLGFLPNISNGSSNGSGYYGINFMRVFLDRKMITYYRELLSIPNPTALPAEPVATAQPPVTTAKPPVTTVKPPVIAVKPADTASKPPVVEPTKPAPSAFNNNASTKRGRGSAVTVKTGFENPFTFVKNSVIAFIFASLGPFPWQMRYLRHFLILPEIILWYFALFFAIKGIIKSFKLQYKVILPLVIFSLLTLGALSLFLCDFGITTRIRIPAFIFIFCLAPLGINWASNNKIFRFFSKNLDMLIKL